MKTQIIGLKQVKILRIFYLKDSPRVTKSFIDKRISALSRDLKQDLKLETTIKDNDDVIINKQLIGNLKGLKAKFRVYKRNARYRYKIFKKAARQGIANELINRAKEIIEKRDLELRDDFKIYWKDNPVAKIKKGSNYLSPEIDIIADEALDINFRKDFNYFT